MKKIIVVVALTFASFAGSYTYAATTGSYAATGGPKVPAPVTTEFTDHFTGATDVMWEAGRNFFKATFSINGFTHFAYFSDNGTLMGIAHYLSPDKLPANLKTEIKNSYAGYWITDLFTYRNADEKAFVITIENADRTVVLKSSDHSGWSVYRSTAKP